LSGLSRKRSEVYPDPLAEAMLAFYRSMNFDKNDTLKAGILASPLAAILLFYVLVSQSTSSLISFSAFVTAIIFIGVSMTMLCDILGKDVGPKSMQDIAEVIR
jgi:hypothetical protein